MARVLKITRFVFHAISLVFISFFLTRKSLNPTIQKKIIRFYPDIKHLLIWTSVPSLKYSGQKHFIDNNCKEHNCFLTKNRSLFGDFRYFDAIIFNLQDVNKGIQDLPSVRNRYQKYIFAANDSADNYPVCNPIYDSFFNWTWTYRTDSTIPYKFITIFNLQDQELGNNFNWEEEMKPMDEKMSYLFKFKSKAAAIFMDKCETRSKREVFLKNLQKHLLKYNMSVDIFGACGTMLCHRRNMKSCLWKLKKNYFFYLAFEDSLADDFITRTVLHAYKNSVVPVVYGKAVYDRFLPPDSFLDGRALGEEKLALTMNQIAHDPKRYLQFFKWKSYYAIEESPILDPCSLCNALNKPKWLTQEVTFHNFRSWWNEDYKQRCDVAYADLKAPYFK